jgi:sulfofructose kinase
VPRLDAGRIDITRGRPGVILLDGHQPEASLVLAEKARTLGIPVVLDAGSVHEGTLGLLDRIDALVASRRFAQDFTGIADKERLADGLAKHAPLVVVTLGAEGLVWRKGRDKGRLGAYPVACVDSTGAGDAFHGAFAAGWTLGMQWPALLRFASAAGALCCTVVGARNGMPVRASVENLMRSNPL